MTHADPATIARLRARIWALEQGNGAPPPILALGAPDAALPWGGLPLARLHQIAAADASALSFAAALLGLAARGGTVLWCRRKDASLPFLPGLMAFGLAPERVVVAESDRAVEVLWAMEEGLRCPALGAVLGEVSELAPAAARRLQLAAEAGGVAALALTGARTTATGATTRWKVGAAPSAPSPWGGLGPPAWSVTLERCRGGLPRTWTLEWRAGEFVDVEPPHLTTCAFRASTGGSVRTGRRPVRRRHVLSAPRGGEGGTRESGRVRWGHTAAVALRLGG
jgi:protein ImuA